MVRAKGPKRRYVLFEVKGKFSEDELKQGLYAEALKFFGEYGSSFVQLKLMEYDGKNGILRCERGKVEEVVGFLALVNELNGKKVRLISKRTSGMINKLKDSSA